mmetsp:Transcript_9289/g.23653  ORF Transcript_9289/g.23653 Transcript_9289/m.23653 type:complete len:330 (+) Transcript_9289:97-1086(+)|eukprot:CAMPEP_0202040878 /NCGR_PEP_ID=MMETSP0962-20130828/22303_1 /ASSEMBLY_ACC=CAM_ASM_000488 /TAXON_ID=4773 /ORGANISM="Schizochytrium aggregatum, Strain ATCC28209" /LENGTH=329 /DNA_ID=CAMNT_0048605173 /DNA_START=96 /DNA_END=1085 /DNA_ORIENTATION=-
MDMNKYLGILRWSLNYTDNVQPSKFEAMDPETRKWLKEALESQVVDPADQMKSLIKVLQIQRGEPETEGPEFVDNKVDALEALQDWVEQIDWAADLHKLGGFKTVIELMQDPEERIRCHALEVFATVVQNNPKTQEWAMELGALPPVVATLDNDKTSETEQAKAMLAVSSLIREHTGATVAFIKTHKGVALLMKIIRSADDGLYSVKARRKSLFLMRYIFFAVPAIKIALAETLASTLNSSALSKDLDVRENSLHLLISIYKDASARARVTDEVLASTRVTAGKFDRAAGHFAELDEVTPELARTLLATLDHAPEAAGTGEDAPKLLEA